MENVQAQRPPPGTRSGCDSRVESFPNRPTAQRGGVSLERTCWAIDIRSRLDWR